MSNYGTLQPGGSQVTALGPGESLTLFNAETPAAPQASLAFLRDNSASFSDQGVTFQILFSAFPTSSVQVLGSNKVPAAAFNLNDWQSLYTSTNKQVDAYTDTGRFAYYCAYLATQSGGGAITVTVQR